MEAPRVGEQEPEQWSETEVDALAKVILCVEEPVEPWIVTLRSLRTTASDVPIFCVSSSPGQCATLLESAGEISPMVIGPCLREAIHDVANSANTHVVVVTAPVIFPPDPFSRAIALAESQARCASISFLSNAAGYLSFPNRQKPGSHQILDKDEVTITRALRACEPALTAASIPYATGPVCLLTRQGLSLIEPFPEHGPGDTALAIADYSCKAQARGMLSLLEPMTFITRPRDVVLGFEGESWLLPHQQSWLEQRFPALVAAPFEESERSAGYEQVIDRARAAVFGLRVLIDGTMLHARETGTQVTVVALVRALLKRGDISYVGLALSGPMPDYAKDLLDEPKLGARVVEDGDFSGFPDVDIVHRPLQANTDTDLSSWRSVGKRTVITILDLIAFQNPTYHGSPARWFEYRTTMRDSISQIDGVITISDDVQANIALESLNMDAARRFTVPCGVDHVKGDEEASIPSEMLDRGFAAERFLLVLGTNYGHKNRDLAIGVVTELRARGQDIALVLAGAHVPFGSSRIAEALRTHDDKYICSIPDVSTRERNWLLRHASVVLYPTAAEGFGLVPNEAAAFRTPTLFVQVGPLLERFPDLPVAPKDWGVKSFADATERLLEDPETARRQVETIALESTKHDWDTATSEIVDVYQALLAMPSRGQPTFEIGWDA